MELETFSAPPRDGPIPNHPRFPVLIDREVAFADGHDAIALFAGNGWGRRADGRRLDFHHFHSTSHEVLGVVAPPADPVGGEGIGRWPS